MLGELRGLPLLTGGRGGRRPTWTRWPRPSPGSASWRLVPGLQALEVNPLWVNGDQVEALDVRRGHRTGRR